MSNRKKTEADALVDLSKPDLRTLAVVLRNQALWPAGFEWGYSHCVTCAAGLAHRLWETVTRTDAQRLAYSMANVFGIRPTVSQSIFVGEFGCDYRDVTPEMVADKIDEVLALQETLIDLSDEQFGDSDVW